MCIQGKKHWKINKAGKPINLVINNITGNTTGTNFPTSGVTVPNHPTVLCSNNSLGNDFFGRLRYSVITETRGLWKGIIDTFSFAGRITMLPWSHRRTLASSGRSWFSRNSGRGGEPLLAPVADSDDEEELQEWIRPDSNGSLH